MYAVQVGSKGIEGVRISQNIGQVCLFEKRAGCGMRISDWSSDVCSSGSFCTWHRRQKGIVDNPDWHFEDMAKLAGDKAKDDNEEIGRASCRDRVCQYVSISVVAGRLKQKSDLSTSYTAGSATQSRQ